MPLSICTACGTQYPESAQTPAQCVICDEERQYVPPRGQTWTTLEALRESHTNTFREYENLRIFSRDLVNVCPCAEEWRRRRHLKEERAKA
jgi:hypothetical protein